MISQYFFHHRNAIDINSVISEAYRLQDGTPTDIHPKKLLDDLQPLTRGQYPVFNKYPKFIVDYQVSTKHLVSDSLFILYCTGKLSVQG